MADFGVSHDDLSDDSDLFIPPLSIGAPYTQSGAEGGYAQKEGQPSSKRALSHAQESKTTKASAKAVKESRESTHAEQEARKEPQVQRMEDVITKQKLNPKNCDDRLEVVVSRQVYDDRSDKSILVHLREVLSDEQICYDNRQMPNLISWRFKQVDPSSPPSLVPLSLIVFTAADYVGHMLNRTLQSFCQGLKHELPGQKVLLAVCGVDNYCKQTARRAFRRQKAGTAKEGSQKSDSLWYGKEAVQDSYALLFLEYGIRTHDVQDFEELTHFISDVSRAVAKTPSYKNQAYLESIVTYKRKKVLKSTAPLLYSQGNVHSNASQDDAIDVNVPHNKVSGISEQELRAAYLKMLVQIPGISAAVAGAIQKKYPTLQALLKAVSISESDLNILSDIQVGESNRNIGMKRSQTISEILTSLDPHKEC